MGVATAPEGVLGRGHKTPLAAPRVPNASIAGYEQPDDQVEPGLTGGIRGS